MIVSVYVNGMDALPVRFGFMLAGIAMILGSGILLLMPWATNHRTNHEVIQDAHFRTKTFESNALFYGMEISEDSSTKPLNTMTCLYGTPHGTNKKGPANLGKIRLYTNVASQLGHIREEEDHWSEIEAMSPMSPTDKVTEFLLQSQTMLQSLSHIQNMTLPGVRLHINNQYANNEDGTDGPWQDEIKDLRLEATICRSSPKRLTKTIVTETTQNDDSDGSRGLLMSTLNTNDQDEDNDNANNEDNSNGSMQKTTSV